ncbi:TPM domain-containing protein [Microcoleus sp. herbarium2]|uniref:TPM domain-containing protein n=1 Tax=Microcoleus sp. herbarium2 TaxID=3055433 RepID=UPI002FD65663
MLFGDCISRNEPSYNSTKSTDYRQVNNTWVTDKANILSDSTEIQLNQMISDLEAKNGSEIAVVTGLFFYQ